MKHSRLWIAAVACCLLAVCMAAAWYFGRPAVEEGTKQIVVEVIHGNGETVEFIYQTDEKYLGDLLLKEGVISGSESELGLYVDTVDGEIADYSVDQSWWQLFCDGETAQVGADAMALQNGCRYTWKYSIG